MSSRDATAAGLGYALLAYGAWGVFPLFWKQLRGIPPLELVAHRVTWACVVYLAIVWLRRRAPEVKAGLRDGATLRTIVPATLMVGTNWLVFIYAVVTDRVLHASLGYFLNPLVSVLLGMLFLGERLRRAQWIAVGLASLGVLSLAGLAEGFPWIGLVLALTFGAYGLLRKVAPVDGLVGASIESLLLVPVAVGYLLWLAAAGEGAMGHEGARIDLLLVTAGLVTALPLLWFANAARRLPLRTLGFMQYIVPTMQLALAVLVFDEPFTDLHLRGFGLIWLGVAVFTLESWWQATRRR
ncbi:MAG: EamA family transporter RarD [Myxococcales bacterium]|nr:EamA family transporter RarD [Myxococcales bacterium]